MIMQVVAPRDATNTTTSTGTALLGVFFSLALGRGRRVFLAASFPSLSITIDRPAS